MKTSIAVCGTGIAGLACALALARRGQQALLLGPRPTLRPADPETYHPRVYAISLASQRLLASLGAWDLMPPARLARVEAMEIRGDAGGRLNLSAWQSAQQELAWIVESGEIERALIQACQVMGIPWVAEKFSSLDHGVLVTDHGTRIEADLMIAADGAQSSLRAAAGLAADVRPYGVTGLVAHFTCALPHQGVALQWFRADGVLALLPMPDTRDGPQVSMVWSIKEPLANELLAMAPEALAAELALRLAGATEGRLGALTLRSPLHGFALTLSQTPMIGPRIALVGDAAHRLHPLAGQGLNLGLGDVQALAEIIGTREPFRSAGDPLVLRRYRRARAEPVLAMRLVTDGLQRLFDVEATPVAWLRNIGLDLVERLPFVKRQLIDGASR